MTRISVMLAAASVAALTLTAVSAAQAACTRLAFSVNDYGKEGPTRDAKQLLDKYIKKWTSERGIKTYTVGPKSVKCELFLNLIVFDEHTCQASASVCWNGPLPKGHKTEASVEPAQKSAATGAERPRRSAQQPAAATGVTTGSVKPAPAAAARAPAPAADPAPVRRAAPPASTQAPPAAASQTPASVVPPLPPSKGGD